MALNPIRGREGGSVSQLLGAALKLQDQGGSDVLPFPQIAVTQIGVP